MYVRVLQDELHFPDDRAIDQDTKSLIRGVSFSFFRSKLIEIYFADFFTATAARSFTSYM